MDIFDILIAIIDIAVILSGGLVMLSLIVYGILAIWSRVSACAKNTKEYLMNKRDFELYKRDFDYWESAKRASVTRCRKCEYRRKVLEEESNHEER